MSTDSVILSESERLDSPSKAGHATAFRPPLDLFFPAPHCTVAAATESEELQATEAIFSQLSPKKILPELRKLLNLVRLVCKDLAPCARDRAADTHTIGYSPSAQRERREKTPFKIPGRVPCTSHPVSTWTAKISV